MTNILLTNTNCSWNKGSAAQVISTVKTMKKIIPEANFTLISYCPELDSKKCAKHDIDVVGYFTESSRKHLLFSYHLSISLVRCIFWKILSKLNLNANRLLNEKYLNEYAKADTIIDLSGDSFADSLGGRSVINGLALLLGILLEKSIVLFSQSIGPFKRWSLPLAKFCLNKVDLIIVREQITKEYLEKLRIRTPIFLTADSAFILESAPSKRVEEILPKEWVNKKNITLIGISASVMLDDENDNYASLMSHITDYIIEKLPNAEVVFVPQVVFEEWADDRTVAKKIYKKITNKNKAKLISNEYSPEELKGIIGLCDMFIGSRMHANIAALSSYVPTMAIAWSHKYYGIMRAVGQEEYVCDFRTMSFNTLASKIDKLWFNRNEIRKELMSKVKTQKELALFSGKLVKCLSTL